MTRKKVVVALGHRALGTTLPEQKTAVKASAKVLADLVEAGADIIITHGGPASFMKALELKKIPIVVPRQAQFDEHINDHQVEFVKLVEERFNNIIGVYDIKNLENIIVKFNNTVAKKNTSSLSHNKEFNEKLSIMVGELF